MNRTCGGCTMCCKLVEVRTLQKPCDQWCTNCEVGVGCRVYETRPQECRGYNCLWLRQEKLSEDLRPDRTHVVFESLTMSRTCLAIVDPWRPHAWQAERPQWLIHKLLSEDVAVVISCNGHSTQVLAPKGRSKLSVWSDLQREWQVRREVAS